MGEKDSPRTIVRV
jgi:hypothetical protein